MGVFVSYGGCFYILGMSSCKCSAKAAQCGSANRCHWAVARFFSFYSGGGEDAKEEVMAGFLAGPQPLLSWRPIS
jgi:hypothetical protein